MPINPAIAALSPAEREEWDRDLKTFSAKVEFKERSIEEVISIADERIAILHRWLHVFIALGVNVPEIVEEFQKLTKDVVVTTAKADEAQEQLLQATADLADARYNLFKEYERLVNFHFEQRPFDPKVQDAKEFLDEWRTQMPKG